MLTEAAVRAVYYIAVPECRRVYAEEGKPLPDAARVDPRASVAGVAVTYSVLMIVVVIVGAVLGGVGVLQSSTATKAMLSTITFVGAGAVIQGIRTSVIYWLLRGVRSGQWHPGRRWHAALAYPRDSDFILQAIVVVIFLLLYHG